MDILSSNVSKVRSAMSESTGMSIMVMSIIIAFILIIGYKLYKKGKNFCNQSSLIFEPRPADHMIEKTKGDSWEIIKSLGTDGHGVETRTIGYGFKPHDQLKPASYGYDYTYSLWLNVDDWNYNNNKPKHIFHKGDRPGKICNPGVWFYPHVNHLYIRVSTHGEQTNVNKTSDYQTCMHWDMVKINREDRYNNPKDDSMWFTSRNPKYADKDLGDHNFCRDPDDSGTPWCYPKPNSALESSGPILKKSCNLPTGNYNDPPPINPLHESQNPNLIDYSTRAKCDIINIPLQRWVHLVLVMHNKTLDVYLNGKLARSCTYKNVPMYNDGNLHWLDEGGFKGRMGEFRYFNRALDADEVYNWYLCGYRCKRLYDYLCNLKVNASIDISTSVGSNTYSTGGSVKIGKDY